MTRSARVRVFGKFDMASRIQEATVTLDRAAGLFSVRPLRRRRAYELPISFVAEWVARHVIIRELADRKRAKAEARKVRRKAA